MYFTGIDSVEKKLYIDLFTDYNNKLRPVAGNDYYSQVEVEVGFSIFNFEGMVRNIKFTSILYFIDHSYWF